MLQRTAVLCAYWQSGKETINMSEIRTIAEIRTDFDCETTGLPAAGAVQRFNETAAAGDSVAACFHLTC
jgi:hypothetical protein